MISKQRMVSEHGWWLCHKLEWLFILTYFCGLAMFFILKTAGLSCNVTGKTDGKMKHS